MHKTKIMTTAIIGLLVTAPVALATWFGPGTYEPNTIHDENDGFMFLESDTSSTSGRNVYFNAFQTEFGTSTNPNSGITGSRILTPGLSFWNAILGVWKDCNGDGTIGLADGAVRDYRSTLALVDADINTICPVGSLHNDGEWVIEYIPIGTTLGNVGNNEFSPNFFNVSGTKVWGDFGLPGAAGAATCPIAPLPHGTTASTGLAIRYLDCFASKRITGSVNTVVDIVDPTNSQGLRFQDQDNPQDGSSALDINLPQSLFGNPETQETGTLQLDSHEDGGSKESAYDTWNCGGGFTTNVNPGLGFVGVDIADPSGGALDSNGDGRFKQGVTDDSGNLVKTGTLAPAVNDPRWSVADGVNQTFHGVAVGGSGDVNDDEVGGTCDDTGASGNDASGSNTYSGLHQTAFFYPDGPHQGGTQNVNKFQTDIDFSFYDGGDIVGGESDLLRTVLGPRTPGYLGAQAGSFWYGPDWEANVVYITTPQSISRATLAPTPALYTTFYAKVGAESSDTPVSATLTFPGATGTYGSEACGAAIGSGQPAQNGWLCDPDLWYVGPDGDSDPDGVQAYPGDTYQLRDIDCNDGRVSRDLEKAGVPNYASLVLLAGGPCLDASNPTYVEHLLGP